MKINEIITELFNRSSTVPWKCTSSNAIEYEAEFKVGELPYQFSAFTGGRGNWVVEFSIESSYSDSNNISQYGINNTGSAATVMSTVVDIMRDFIKQHSDDIVRLEFTSDEHSRSDLYVRMVRRLLPDWELSRSDDGRIFSLTKPAL